MATIGSGKCLFQGDFIMKRLAGGMVAISLLVAAVAFSGTPKLAPDLQVKLEARNPWNHLRLNNDPADFQFAIVSDRTGGHRAKIFSLAVEQLNLLQPEFVLSVGDLIEGYKDEADKLAEEWKEFQGYIARLQMPFFYVPGNHDLSTAATEKLWTDQFGRRYYHFLYRSVLFLILNSNDPIDAKGGHLGEEQIGHCKQVLEANKEVRWTIVVLHHPLWSGGGLETSGWLEMEKALSGRPYTVFAGHIHKYEKFVRNGQRYYQLATTGGASKVRGLRYGEVDHITWVTMKKDGPLMANLLLDGILPEDMRKPETSEEGDPIKNRKPVHVVRGKLFVDGKPMADARIVLASLDPRAKSLRADALTEADGTFTLSTYTANDGVPVGEYAVTVAARKAGDGAKPGPNLLPVRYSRPETTPLRFRVQEGANEMMLELAAK
jgi:hypothetical protein